MFGLISGALGVASGIKGLFSKGPKERTPRDGILSQARGARDAAAKYGFNPLTLLQAGAGHGFTQAGGGTPPLASIAAIQDGLKGIDDVVSGDQARRRQADQLELDLAKVRLDQARSGVGLGQPGTLGTPPASFARSGTLTGNRAATVVQTNVRPAPAKFGRGETPSPLDSQREIEVLKTPNAGGFYELENDWTGGPIYLPGESMEGDLDNVLVAATLGVPQVLGRAARRLTYGDTTPLDDLKAAKKREPEHKKEVQDFREKQLRGQSNAPFSTPFPHR